MIQPNIRYKLSYMVAVCRQTLPTHFIDELIVFCQKNEKLTTQNDTFISEITKNMKHGILFSDQTSCKIILFLQVKNWIKS